MAFTKTPANSTYQTKQLELVKELDSRGTSTAKDGYILNGYAETKQNKTTKEEMLSLFKRAGCSSIITAVGTNDIRGMFHWYGENRLFVAIDNAIYVYNATTYALVTTLAAAFGTTSGEVGFEEFMYSTGTVKVIATDGTTINIIDNVNTVTVVVGNPVHFPCPVTIDGYLFVLKLGTADIYNSANDDPSDWSGLEFISAELRPDKVFRIASLNNYLVAFGQDSLEYFYDAANAAGSSPLSRNDSATKYTGYLGAQAKIGGKIFFVGYTSDSGPEVFLLEDFKATPIGTEPIRRHLEAYPETLSGAIVSFNGHDFYVLSTAQASYALDLKTLLWTPWSFKALTRMGITKSTPSYNTATAYGNFFCTDDDNTVYKFNNALGQDAGVSFPWAVVTPEEDFDSYNRKACHRLSIHADDPGASLLVLVQTADDDFTTWSTGQSIDLHQDLPCNYRWGTFRRRAHKLSYTGSLPLRVYKIELDINIGQT